MKTATDPLQVLEGRVGSNDATVFIAAGMPYEFHATVEGVAPILFHRYSVDSVAEKKAAKKGSVTKKSDDTESYVYRVSDQDRRLGLSGLMFTAALAHAGRSIQDPRSPRKSALELIRASIIALDDVAPLSPDTEAWDYMDIRRVVVQRAAVSRERPAMRAGWRVTFRCMNFAPEYVELPMLRDLIHRAGQFSGLGDFRPTFGRFQLTNFEVVTPKL